jgi:hypothetical protein
MANENGQVGEPRQELLPLGLLPAERSLETATGRFAFDPLPRESARAFAAFRVYLELGPQRTLAKAAEKLGRHHGVLEKWSTRFDWQARVKAHAAHLAEVERLAIEALVKERAVEWDKMHETVRREAWREAEETIEMVRKARQEWREKGKPPGWEGMARMLELAFKLKQLATGMASEVKEVQANVTGTLEVEWEVALRKAYGPKTDAGVIDVGEAPSAPKAELANPGTPTQTPNHE